MKGLPVFFRGGMAVFLILACAGGVWAGSEIKTNPGDFHFAIIGDRSYKPAPGVLEDAVGKLNLLQPDFVLSVGDLVEGETHDKNLLNREWDEFQTAIKKLEMPFFPVVGDHDIFSGMMFREWQKRWGRPYYSFVYKNVLFLALNSQDGRSGTLGDEQLKYIADVLGRNKNARWTFLFLHDPMWIAEVYKQETGWAELQALLKDRPHTIFSGHFHRYMKSERNGHNYYTLAPTGAWKAGLGEAFGEFDAIAWVSMTDKGPRIVNLKLAGMLGEDAFSDKTALPLAKLVFNPPLAVAPVFVDSDTFREGQSKVLLRNPVPVPLKFSASFETPPGLKVCPDHIEYTLWPLGSKMVDLKLTSDQPLPLGKLAGLKMDWKISLEIPGMKPFSHTDKKAISVSKMLECPRRKTPVVVDGRLEEWPAKDFPYVADNRENLVPNKIRWLGAQDCSFKFAVAYDDQYVYLVVDTVDDRLVTDPKRKFFIQDGTWIRLDTRPLDEQFSHPTWDNLKDILSLNVTPAQGLIQTADLPKGTKAACRITPKGYATEIAIPIAWLDHKQGGAWKSFRLNVTALDSDDLEAGTIQLSWNLDWRIPFGDPAAGTFKRR